VQKTASGGPGYGWQIETICRLMGEIDNSCKLIISMLAGVFSFRLEQFSYLFVKEREFKQQD
jgi:hypothetical protein